LNKIFAESSGEEENRFDNPVVFWTYNIQRQIWFQNLITLVIIMNTITLSLVKYPSFLPETIYLINLLNNVFTMVFTFECMIKLQAFGLKKYFADFYNILDIAIVYVAFVEL